MIMLLRSTSFATGALFMIGAPTAYAQRRAPPLPSATAQLTTCSALGSRMVPAKTGSCGVSSRPVVRVATGAVAGAAAGYLLVTLTATILSDGGEPLDAQTRRTRTRFTIGFALVGAVWEGIVAPRRGRRRNAPA